MGLEQLVAGGAALPRAVLSRKWPGDANLEVAHVWPRRGGWRGDYLLDDQPVAGITAFLTPPGTTAGTPFRLKANDGKSFQGSIVLGLGFVLEQDETAELIARNARNREVLFPYLNGEDLNARPDQSPSRWVINFQDWPLERAETYPEVMAIMREKVKPERDRNTFSQNAREKWWQYERGRPELYAAIAGMDRVLVTAEASRTGAFSRVAPSLVFAHMLVVMALTNYGCLALMRCMFHSAWSWSYGTSLKGNCAIRLRIPFRPSPSPPTPSAWTRSANATTPTANQSCSPARKD